MQVRSLTTIVKALLTTLLLGFCSFSSPPTNTVFKGEVISIQKLNIVNQPSPVFQFLLQTKECVYTVEVGPDWLLQTAGILILPREKVEVEGTLQVLDGKNFIVARQIKKKGTLIRLRAPDGTPYWGNQREFNKCL